MESLGEQETLAVAGAPSSGTRRLLRGAIAVLSWLSLAVVLAAWAFLHAGDLWWPATLLLFGPRWLLALPLFPLLLAAAVWRRRSLGLLLFTLLLVLGPVMGFHVPWPTLVPAASPALRLRVLTCNIHHQRPNRAALERLFAESQLDVVAMQELPSRESFASFAEGEWHVHRSYGHFFASRYPIRRAVRLGADSMTPPGSLVRYELETPLGPVVLFSLHFASPRDGLYAATHHPATGAAELESNSDVRQQQSENLTHLAAAVKGPVLLLGDFNTPSESALFRRVWVGYEDAFSSAGWGWGFTFLGARTAVRIDHILAGPGWRCQRCWVAPNVGPPHRPVLAELILSEPRPTEPRQ